MSYDKLWKPKAFVAIIEGQESFHKTLVW